MTHSISNLQFWVKSPRSLPPCLINKPSPVSWTCRRGRLEATWGAYSYFYNIDSWDAYSPGLEGFFHPSTNTLSNCSWTTDTRHIGTRARAHCQNSIIGKNRRQCWRGTWLIARKRLRWLRRESRCDAALGETKIITSLFPLILGNDPILHEQRFIMFLKYHVVVRYNTKKSRRPALQVDLIRYTLLECLLTIYSPWEFAIARSHLHPIYG